MSLQICTICGIINDPMDTVMNVDTWAVVLATFLGPIAALLITFVRDSRTQKYNRRLHVFRTLMATRKIAISPDHVNALNCQRHSRIDTVFPASALRI
jgi:hypothetical protein